MVYDMYISNIPDDNYLYVRPLYPHAFEDLVFLVFQSKKLNSVDEDTSRRYVLKPICQWSILISLASLILYALRVANRQRDCAQHNNAASVYYLVAFVDSVAVFLGVALDKIGKCRAERWFLIAFSVFGLIFRIIYTDNLFVMLTTSNQNRITSIDQLVRENIPITVDFAVSPFGSTFYIHIKS